MKADLQEDWCGKKVAVIGLGVSNLVPNPGATTGGGYFEWTGPQNPSRTR